MSNLSKLEALLFYYGEPIEINKISQVFNWNREKCEKTISDLIEKLGSDSENIFEILKKDSKVQLAAKSFSDDIKEKLLSEEFKGPLSPASLEVLSIIAYAGPMPRAIVDYIRGVNSSFTIRNLLIKGLIEKKKTGGIHQCVYEVSFDLLRHLGIAKVENLPDYEKCRTMFKELIVDDINEEC